MTPVPAGLSSASSARARLSVALLGAAALALPGAAQAASPLNDPFYRYAGSTPLSEIAPGTVLATRVKPYHVAGLQTPIRAVQLAYRTTNQVGRPVLNVTSVLQPPFTIGRKKLLSYQSFYDSLNPADEPSYAIAGGTTFGGSANAVEGALIAPFLLSGYTVASRTWRVRPRTSPPAPSTAATRSTACAPPTTHRRSGCRRRRRRRCSATPAARSPPSGRARWHPPTPRDQREAARRGLRRRAREPRPTTCTTSRAARSGRA